MKKGKGKKEREKQIIFAPCLTFPALPQTPALSASSLLGAAEQIQLYFQVLRKVVFLSLCKAVFVPYFQLVFFHLENEFGFSKKLQNCGVVTRLGKLVRGYPVPIPFDTNVQNRHGVGDTIIKRFPLSLRIISNNHEKCDRMKNYLMFMSSCGCCIRASTTLKKNNL